MITLQPETEGNTIVVKASEHLTASDYKDILIPKIKELLTQHDKINAVIILEDSFQGWEPSALAEALPFALKEHHHIRHLATVGAPQWLTWISTLAGHLLIEELKNFDPASFQEALAWAKEEK